MNSFEANRVIDIACDDCFVRNQGVAGQIVQLGAASEFIKSASECFYGLQVDGLRQGSEYCPALYYSPGIGMNPNKSKHLT
jgi:hypothetical protein